MLEITAHLDEGMPTPERHGAWIDLAAAEDVDMRRGEVRIIPLGIRMQLPEGYEGIVAPRSSMCLKHGIMAANSIGVIENDYAGDDDVWGLIAYAVRDTHVARGTRIAQFRVQKTMEAVEFAFVGSMPAKNRGGYGSTGQ